jgi:hypothetical protein
VLKPDTRPLGNWTLEIGHWILTLDIPYARQPTGMAKTGTWE